MKDLQPFYLTPRLCCLNLHADAALQFELQADHVHLGGRAQQSQLGHFGTHLVYGHLYRAEVRLVLVHDGYALLHVWEAVGGWVEVVLGETNRISNVMSFVHKHVSIHNFGADWLLRHNQDINDPPVHVNSR